VRISATLEYGLQATLEIAANTEKGTRTTAEQISRIHQIPLKFLESILTQLRDEGVLTSQRGPKGGYLLDVDPKNYSIAELFRALEGPLAAVRDKAPETTKYKGSAKNLTSVWVASRAALRGVLEHMTIEDVLDNRFEPAVNSLLNKKDSWKRR
jgi:Rrf2 family protein